MNIRSLIVALPLVVFSHPLVAIAAVPGNVRSMFPARGTETGPMGGARVSALAGGAVRVDAGLKERWTSHRIRNGLEIPSGDDLVELNQVIGEFHFGALDTGMFHYSLLPADDQAERAKLYREYHEATLRNPRYVGAHWFQWWDQVLTARCDGENFQCGFLSVTDTPYRELVEAARDIARRMYGLRYGRVKRPKVDPCF